MDEYNDYIHLVDEDTIKDIVEYENLYLKFKNRNRKSKKKILTNKAIANAIRRIARYYIGSPEDFPETIIELLEEEGYETRFLTYKRIWRIYEEMVKKKVLKDFLNVVS